MIITKIEPLPEAVRGFTKKKKDCYIIVLNSRLTREANEETYLHELRHIERGDFERADTLKLEKEVRHDHQTVQKAWADLLQV